MNLWHVWILLFGMGSILIPDSEARIIAFIIAIILTGAANI